MNSHVDTVPLRQWVDSEESRTRIASESEQQQQHNNSSDLSAIHSKRQSLLRRTIVAYGIVELLRRAEAVYRLQHSATEASAKISVECIVDNFVVQVYRSSQAASSSQAWNDIAAVGMVSCALQAQIYEPSFLSNMSDETTGDGMYLEVDISPSLPNNVTMESIAGLETESSHCHDFFGTLLYELYAGIPPPPTQLEDGGSDALVTEEPELRAKKGRSYQKKQRQAYNSLQELGAPQSISMLVQNLIDGSDLYPSLEAASEDIHLLLRDPDCYLHDSMQNVQLKLREGKVYGRESEISLITDAFCRVSTGTSEALFIGGFSGSGKTMLVNSLRARVDIAGGGYVLTQKVDQMSGERQLWGILAAFNDLCVIIKEKRNEIELRTIATELMDKFEDDFAVLARLLPNITLLCPQRGKSHSSEAESEQTLVGLQNMSFTMQRFLRIVSSKRNPVCFFYDDCQWANSSCLDLIYAILSDSNCFFFVGSYRDNEVHTDHHLFGLMAELDLSAVRMTHLNLGGLSLDALNVMIAESLCLFPRICKPLAVLVYDKTAGNPFSAIEFLTTLVDSRLLRYSPRVRRWIWDEDSIRSLDVTASVLYLLSNKMSCLPDNVQEVLKVLSCFGIETDAAIVDHLCMTSSYSQGLEEAMRLEFVYQKNGSGGVRFAHDKVREAAYGLVADIERLQLHTELGKRLMPLLRSQNIGSHATFQIIDQVNYGLAQLEPQMHREAAECNCRAGSVAMNLGDHTTAASYLSTAMLLLEQLPEDHWQSNYEFSLRLHFLRGKAAYSCGDADGAIEMLKKILHNGRGIEDKLDSHHLYLMILLAGERREEAFVRCRDVLLQLNENIPDAIDAIDTTEIVQKSILLIDSLSIEDWLSMPNMSNTSFRVIIKLYSIYVMTAYWQKPSLLPFLCSRVLQITLQFGLTSYSIVGLVQYATVLAHTSRRFIPSAYRLGNAAIQLFSQRFESPHLLPQVYYNFYGMVAIQKEPIQECIEMLRKGLNVGLSVGDSGQGLINGYVLVRLGLLSGANLPKLKEEMDYYFKLASRFNHKIARIYLTIFREAASSLIDDHASSSPQAEADAEAIISGETYHRGLFLSRAFTSFWLGHADRCQHNLEKLSSVKLQGSHNELIAAFYGAINTYKKWGKGKKVSRTKVRKMHQDALKLVRSAAELCPWNSTNKQHLLEAEFHSFEKKNEAAQASYAAAISSAESSKFVHEQGLAAERAAFHFKRLGDMNKSREYFDLAKECYAKWGSSKNVGLIDVELEKLSDAAATNSEVTNCDRTAVAMQDATTSHHAESSHGSDRMEQSAKQTEVLPSASAGSKRGDAPEGQEAKGQAPADLSSCPKDLYALWYEFDVGIDGNKPARLFTPSERGKVKFKYCRRKIVWDVIGNMVKAGTSAQDAIELIYAEYGQRPVNGIINELKRARATGNPRLGIPGDGTGP